MCYNKNLKGNFAMEYDFSWIKKQKQTIEGLSNKLGRQAMAYVLKYEEAGILGKMNSLRIIKNLILEGADVNYPFINNETLLSRACKIKNGEKLVKMFIEANADVNHYDEKGCTPLIYACKSGNPISATMLLDNGADVTYISENGSAVCFAYKNSMYEIVHRIIEISDYCASKDHLSGLSDVFCFEKNCTKLPCYNEVQQNIIEDLLSIEGGLDAQDINGETFLHKSIKNKNYYLACEFLKAKANPNMQDMDGNTPLHKLFKIDFDESWTMIMTRLFLDAGTKVDIKNKNGETVTDICPNDIRFKVLLEDAKNNKDRSNDFINLTFAFKPFEKMFCNNNLLKALEKDNITIKQYNHEKKRREELSNMAKLDTSKTEKDNLL